MDCRGLCHERRIGICPFQEVVLIPLRAHAEEPKKVGNDEEETEDEEKEEEESPAEEEEEEEEEPEDVSFRRNPARMVGAGSADLSDRPGNSTGMRGDSVRRAGEALQALLGQGRGWEGRGRGGLCRGAVPLDALRRCELVLLLSWGPAQQKVGGLRRGTARIAGEGTWSCCE